MTRQERRAIDGKPYAGNPHVALPQYHGGTGRLEVASVATPRRGSLLYRIKTMLMGALALGCACAFGEQTKEVGIKGGASGTAAQKLQACDFLLNKDFKKNAKYYLCLFSASWCGPCRREMPRIAKTYAESLKGDPNVELIHFSRDSEENKALAWAKEHDVKFPVVKYNGGNPLDLQTRGIPHLFIVKADGTLLEQGHPKKLFTDEKLRELKIANGGVGARASATER